MGNSSFFIKLILTFANLSQERSILVYKNQGTSKQVSKHIIYQIEEEELLFTTVLKLKSSEKYGLTPPPRALSATRIYMVCIGFVLKNPLNQ